MPVEGTRRERLTGAIIFFAVLAIAAPELFDGPGDRARTRDDMPADTGPPVATYDLAIGAAIRADTDDAQRVTLAISPEQSEAIAQAVPPPVIEAPTPPTAASGTTDAVVSPPQTTAPASASAGTASGTPAAAPAPAAGRAVSAASAPAAKPATGTAARDGGWWVQLGSFASSDNAQRLARDLRTKGFNVEVAKGRSGGRELHLVRSGPVADRAEATVLQGRLAAAGAPGGMLVAP